MGSEMLLSVIHAWMIPERPLADVFLFRGSTKGIFLKWNFLFFTLLGKIEEEEEEEGKSEDLNSERRELD